MGIESGKSIIIVMGGLYCGGAERVASNLMYYWHQQGWRIKLITMEEPEEDYYNVPVEVSRTVIDFGGTSNNKIIGFLKNIPFVWRLRRELKNTQSNIVLSFLTRTNIHSIIASLGLKKRVIISERNDTTKEVHGWPWPFLRRVFYKYADVVTANSEVAISDMQNYITKEKLQIVPNPVFIPEEMANPGTSQAMLNVGRLVPQKAQDLLIEALALIGKDKLNQWKLHILGVGEEEENLKTLTAKHDLSDVICFRGWVDNVTNDYQEAGIFILSSKYEGTPNALLEAMSYGLPCIISDSLPGAMELIQDGKNGLIFSSGNAEDLASKLSELMMNPELRNKLGENAREKVQAYSPENVTPVWDTLISSN